MLAALVRGFFLFAVIGWYTSGVWKGMNKYYDEQFKKYLHTEMEKNPRMKEHLEGSRFVIPESSNIITPPNHHLQENQNFQPKFIEKEQDSNFEEQLTVLNEMKKNSDKNLEAVYTNDDDQGVCSINAPNEKIYEDGNVPCG